MVSRPELSYTRQLERGRGGSMSKAEVSCALPPTSYQWQQSKWQAAGRGLESKRKPPVGKGGVRPH